MKSTTCHIPLKAGTKRREEKALPTGYQIRSDSAVAKCVCVRGYKGCMTMQAKSLHYRDYRRKFNPATRNRQQHDDTTRRREAEAEAAALNSSCLFRSRPARLSCAHVRASAQMSNHSVPVCEVPRGWLAFLALTCLVAHLASHGISWWLCACLACLPACILESSLSLSLFLSLRVFALRTC